MSYASHCSPPRPPRLRWLAVGAWAAGLSLGGAGCLQPPAAPAEKLVLVSVTPIPPEQPSACLAQAAEPPAVPGPGQPARAEEGAVRPVKAEHQTSEPLPTPMPAPEPAVKRVPINLDTVLRLAEGQNRQIAVAREKLHEACTEKRIAETAWVPDIYVGPSYYRHDGGIQAVNGNLVRSNFNALFSGVELNGRFDVREATFLKVNAERRVLQQKGELSRITSEQLLEAANTYLDLLLARSTAAVARRMEGPRTELRNRAEKAFAADKSVKFLVDALQAEFNGHQQAIAKLDQQGDAAAAKLAYLLGLDTCVELVPVDEWLMPFDLVDACVPAHHLVNLTLTNGPGIQETERLLAVISSGIERMQGPAALMPTLEMRMAEGGFFAGPGSSFGGDNRWDLNLQARWNLNGLVAARDRQRLVHSKREQVHLSYQDLRGKLAAGVQEARLAILSGREQIALGAQQIRHAQESYRESNKRLVAFVGNSTPSEVQQAIRLMELAEFNYLQAINAYDKAQLRLMILLGPAYCNLAAPPASLPAAADGPSPAASGQALPDTVPARRGQPDPQPRSQSTSPNVLPPPDTPLPVSEEKKP